MNRAQRRSKSGLWTPPQAQEPQVKHLDDSGPKLRLLACRECKSIEEIPDYEGNPRNDVLLQDTLSRHMTEWSTHEVALIKVPVKWWQDKTIQPQLIKQISQGGSKGLDELDAEYYASKATYADQAMECFNRHQRPKEGCIDWHEHDKRIGNPTTEGWKTGPKVYVCDFCPVSSWVRTQKLKQAGAYDA